MNSASALVTGLAHPGRPQEDERPDRPLGVLQAGARPPHGLGDGFNRLILADDPAVQRRLHLQQPLRFLFGDLHHRHAGPHRDDFGDVVGRDARAVLAPLPAGTQLLQLVLERRLVEQELLGVVVAGFLDRLGTRLARLAQIVHHAFQGARFRALVHAHTRCRLVDQVDGFVRQETVGHVAGREVDRRLEGLVADDQAMVLFIGPLDPAQDRQRLVDARLLDHHRLEAPLQGGVALDVFAVFVERRGPDDLQLAARKGRLEDIGGVHRRAGRAGAHQHVDFVDEEDRRRRLELVDDALQPLFELAAVHRAGDQRTDVELQHPLAQQRLGGLPGDDALRQPLDDGRLADAWFADQGRIVLGAARQDLDDALDLRLAPDHRVELAGLGQAGQVGRQLIEQRGLGGGFLLLRGADGLRRHLPRRSLLQDTPRLAPHLLRGDTESPQHVDGDALALAHQAQQQVLGADVVVPHAAGFFDRQLQHLLRRRRQFDLAAGVPADSRQTLDRLFDARRIEAELAQDAPGDAALFADQAEQQVLGADVVVVQPLGLFVSQAENPARPLGEPLHLIGHGALLRARRIPPASVGFYQKRVLAPAGLSSQRKPIGRGIPDSWPCRGAPPGCET
jgi:hypothetical protein